MPAIQQLVRKAREVLAVKSKSRALDSNNITKIKTFNGVPHEAVVL